MAKPKSKKPTTSDRKVAPKAKVLKEQVVSPVRTVKVVKSVTTKPKKSSTKNNGTEDTLLNRIKENWSQPTGGYNKDTKRTFEPGYDKYPYGSLTGRKK
jgi:hypothetical protein